MSVQNYHFSCFLCLTYNECSVSPEGRGLCFVSAEGVALGRAVLRGAKPTPEPLSCPSASAVTSADLAAGAWFLTAAPHCPLAPSHPQCWAVLGFQDTAVVAPPSPGLLTPCSVQLILSWVCWVIYTDTPV